MGARADAGATGSRPHGDAQFPPTGRRGAGSGANGGGAERGAAVTIVVPASPAGANAAATLRWLAFCV